MKAAAFDYVRAESVRDAVRHLVDADGDGKLIAGGQSFAPVLAMRLARPALVVDVNRIPGLGAFTRHADRVRVGALVRHCELLEQDDLPLLAEAARWIGHAAIRSRGTFGGSIAHADPSAELPVVAAALDASIRIVGPEGERVETATDFFAGALETTLTETEMVVGVDLPVPTAWGFAELSRRHGDFGLVTAVAAEAEGTWRLCLGGLASVPFRAREAEDILSSGPLDAGRLRDAARAAAGAVPTGTDLHASAGYRTAMAEEFAHRALLAATTTAQKGAA